MLRILREQLHEAPLCAARYNSTVKHLYRRLRNTEKVARIAASPKPLPIADAVYKSRDQFHMSEEIRPCFQYSI